MPAPTRSTDPVFIDRPTRVLPFLAWPSDNRTLFTDPARFVARTRANPDYGRPGFTRDCGRRFHRGLDIAPAHAEPDGRLHRVVFSDCARGTEYPSDEPGWIPRDRLYAMADGVVAERHDTAETSTLGRHLILFHRWPGSTTAAFYALYAHLDEITVAEGATVTAGQVIGTMGMTSASADARTWMAIAPHLHLEFFDERGRSFDPEQFLCALLVRHG